MEEKDLDDKIMQAIGHHRRYHMSMILDKRSSLVFSRPGRRGYFSLVSINPKDREEIFDVWEGGTFIGRMNYGTICRKFGTRF